MKSLASASRRGFFAHSTLEQIGADQVATILHSRMVSIGTVALCALQTQLALLRQLLFEVSEIAQQPLPDKPEEIKTKLWVLEIELS